MPIFVWREKTFWQNGDPVRNVVLPGVWLYADPGSEDSVGGGGTSDLTAALVKSCQDYAAQRTADMKSSGMKLINQLWSEQGSVEAGATKGALVGLASGLFKGLPELGVRAGVSGLFVGGVVGFAIGTGSAALIGPVINPIGRIATATVFTNLLPIVNQVLFANCMSHNVAH